MRPGPIVLVVVLVFVLVFASQAGYAEQPDGVPGAAFRYFVKSEYQSDGHTRQRIVQNHLYTYLPSSGARSINDLDLARLRGEGARAMAV